MSKSYAMQSSRSEEAHWSSFRGEVLQLQQTLVQSLMESNGNNGCPSSTRPVKTSRDRIDSMKGDAANDGDQIESTITGKQIDSSAAVDEHDTALSRNYHDTPQSQLQLLSPLEEAGDDFESINNDNDIKTYNITSTNHQYLELIGMEEVDKSICSVNNKTHLSSHDNSNNYNNNNPTNTNAMSHASQNTSALSIATQELAEMKLKLALTESERDELEFELMQKQIL